MPHNQYDISNRWKQFTEYTTFHGLRHVTNAKSTIPRLLWLLIIATCTGALVYQSRELILSYMTESTATQITNLGQSYPHPRLMVAVPTWELIRAERQEKHNRLPDMDPEAFLYMRSIAEDVTYVPETIENFDPERARRKFREYLVKNNVTWAESLEPYILDIEPWMMSTQGPMDPLIHVSRRIIHYPFTYHLIEPVLNQTMPSYSPYSWAPAIQGHYVLLLNWTTSPMDQHVRSVTLVGFEILNDNFPFNSGEKFRLSYDVTAHSRLNLRRRHCDDTEGYMYKKFDEYSCREKCSLDAILAEFPDSCTIPPDLRFSLLDFYPKAIPCTSGMYIVEKSGHNFTRPSEAGLPLESTIPNSTHQKIMESSRKCENEHCLNPCKELVVKYQLNKGVIAADQDPLLAMLVFEWPTPDAVVLFDEMYMYTTDALVGQWGGLTGLWLGASMMSFVEIIYHWCCCCFEERNAVSVQDLRMK